MILVKVKQKKGCEYELCVVNLNRCREKVKIRSIGLSTSASFASESNLEFCDLGFYNIRFKGYFKPETAKMNLTRLFG